MSKRSCHVAGSGGLGRLRSLSMNTRNAAERLPRFGRELWEPYLADTLLRVFASCGISGQLGTFTRPFLDFTQGSVRLLTLDPHVARTQCMPMQTSSWYSLTPLE